MSIKLNEKVHDCVNGNNNEDHKNYNFLDCDWFKKLLFFTNSLAKLLSDNLLLDSFFFIGQFNNPITFKAVVTCVLSFLFLAANYH